MEQFKERRAAPRFALTADVRYLLRGELEGRGRLLDISEKGLALLADMDAENGDDIVIYADNIGRLTGKVARCFHEGVAVLFTLSPAQRDTIGARIRAALRGAPYLRLVENRSSIRIRYNLETRAQVVGEDALIDCTIVDMSRTGCLIRSSVKPRIGAKVRVGALKGVVCRHSNDGFAVEFAYPAQPVRAAAAQAGGAA
ncbi:PilZ domain-containing protein [Amphiplicatus metriothermophilus]|uniref:PilZ domain-containing protein n=1 Tax=Amphiplicatus metriothermophilus TaxID=1519374 RepID=A0A239PWP7_9PROT|nr:PilZ domain-containing protein [Amphiplicatus metriothermophilus]MBB5519553.1 hypothetical protein [Amphiplicatus metriothermophilus]SNT74117.1 PilZ domain-containing protein [Amphiplicatus metriothermophilus]